MSENKWHKNCGGKVMYQKPLEEGTGFEQAGMCLKCNDFPILEEDIIFERNPKTVERFYDVPKEWYIVSKDSLIEELE